MIVPEGIEINGPGRQVYKPGQTVPDAFLSEKLKKRIGEAGKKFSEKKASGESKRKTDEEKRIKAGKDKQKKLAEAKQQLKAKPELKKVEEKAETPDTGGKFPVTGNKA